MQIKFAQSPMEHPNFRRLPPVEREVVYRRHKQQLWIDIAEELDLSEALAKAVYERAVAKLSGNEPILPEPSKNSATGQKRGRNHVIH